MRFISLTVCFALAGCSIHPQTEDFSRSYLPDIVYRVRCETADAIRAVLPGEPDALRSVLARSAITFNFDFVMTETNDVSSLGGVGIPVSTGTFRIGWDAGLEKKRETHVIVNVTDAFETLVKLENCATSDHVSLRYPVTGRVGIEDSMRNYVSLYRQQTGLFAEYSDHLTFTTTVRASVTPSITLVSAADRLINAQANLFAERSDKHSVKLSFSPPVDLTAEQRRLAKANFIVLLDPSGHPIDPRTPAPVSRIMQQPDGRNFGGRSGSQTERVQRGPGPSKRYIEQDSLDRFRLNEERLFQRRVIDALPVR